jgi:hypothetical protein
VFTDDVTGWLRLTMHSAIPLMTSYVG